MLNSLNSSYEKRKSNSRNRKRTLNNITSKSKTSKIPNSSKVNYKITVTKTRPKSKNPCLRNISLNKKNKNNINNNKNGDLIPFLSNISELNNNHLNNNKLYITNIKLISESINEQILFSRSSTNDILLYMNQIFKPRFKGSMANINEKYIIDKLYDINLRMEKITNFKNDLENNIENNENSFIAFYEEINRFLSNMKISFFKDNKNKKIEFINIQNMKDKYLDMYKKQNIKREIKDDDEVNLDLEFIHEKNSYNSTTIFDNNENNSKINYANILPNSYSRSLNKGINLSIHKHSNRKNITNNNNIYINDDIIILSKMTLDFLKDMSNLQELILKKDKNVKEFKKNFEIAKNNLKNICEVNLEKSKNNKINEKETQKKSEKKNIECSKLNYDINELSIKNKELNNLIKKLEEEKKERNDKIDNLEKEINKLNEENKIVEKLELENKTLNEKSLKLIQDIELIKEENIKLKSQQINFNKISEENKTYLGKIKSFEEEMKKLKEKDSENGKNLNLENMKLSNLITELKAENKKYKNKSISEEEEKAKLSNKMNKLEEQNKTLLLTKIKNNSNIKELNLEITKLKNEIKEKELKINELNDKIKNHNDLNINIISGNNKESKLNEEIDNIKNYLKELNIKTNISIKNLLEKDKQFSDIKGNNKEEKENNIENNSPIIDIIKDINNYQNEYKQLIEQFKSNNIIFSITNKN